MSTPIANPNLHSGARSSESRSRVRAGAVGVRAGLVVAGVLAGLVFTVGAAHADPDPQPQPTPGPPATQPIPQPQPTPTPGPGTPQPIPTPPPTIPTPPVGTPNPQPGPPVPQPTTPPTTGTTDDPGFFDIPGQIRKAINDFFTWVATSSLGPILETMGQTILGTPDLTTSPPVRAMWTGTLVVANALLVLFVVIGGFTVMTQHTVQSQYGLKQVLPRIAIGAIAANVSMLLFSKVIPLVNALCVAIVGEGVDPQAAAQAIANAVTGAQVGNSFLLAMLLLAMVVMAIVVMLMFIVRTAILVLLVGSAPLALLCHASPHTESLAFLWWRSVAACFGIQIAEAVILLATLRVFLTPGGPTVLGIPATGQGVLAILVCLTMMWLLIKLPGLARRMVLGNAFRKQGRGLIGQVISTVLLLKAFGLTGGSSKATATTRTTPRPTPTRTVPITPTPTAPRTTSPRPTPRRTSTPAPDPAPAGQDRAPYRNTRWRDDPPNPADPGGHTGPATAAAPTYRTPTNRTPPSRFGDRPTTPAPQRATTSRPDDRGAPARPTGTGRAAPTRSDLPRASAASTSTPPPSRPTAPGAAPPRPGPRPGPPRPTPPRPSRPQGSDD